MILKKKVAAKQVAYGNLPASIGKLQCLDAFADQGSEVNLMPLPIYTQLTKEVLATTRVRLSFPNHSYIYPLGIAEDVLVNVAGFLNPVDFVVIDDKGNECMPLILGAPFLTTARAVIKYEKGKIELKSGRRKIHFPMIPQYVSEGMMERRLINNAGTPHNHVREKILAWEARIKNYKEVEIGECKGGDKNSMGVDEHAKNPVKFTEGDLVLLRHSEIKVPPDEPNPCWYGPFTIKSLCHNGVVTLSSKRGGEVTANVERLKHHHPDSKDYIYQGYVISRYEVT